MKKISKDDVKAFLTSYLKNIFENKGFCIDTSLSDDFDIFKNGVVDSFGLLKLTVEMETHFGKEIDFEDLDPNEMSIIGPLSNYVARKLNP